jgi:hypothetical protein
MGINYENLHALYVKMGAAKRGDKYRLPEPLFPEVGAQFNEQAIALLRKSGPLYKRADDGPASKEMREVYRLFIGGNMSNFGVTAETCNHGIFCYYMNHWEIGKAHFDMVVDQFDRSDPASVKVCSYFAAFHNYVVTHYSRTWLRERVRVNPDYFLTKDSPETAPLAWPKETQEFNPDVLI